MVKKIQDINVVDVHEQIIKYTLLIITRNNNANVEYKLFQQLKMMHIGLSGHDLTLYFAQTCKFCKSQSLKLLHVVIENQLICMYFGTQKCVSDVVSL